jgi:hypothetical protein
VPRSFGTSERNPSYFPLYDIWLISCLGYQLMWRIVLQVPCCVVEARGAVIQGDKWLVAANETAPLILTRLFVRLHCSKRFPRSRYSREVQRRLGDSVCKRADGCILYLTQEDACQRDVQEFNSHSGASCLSDLQFFNRNKSLGF